MRERTLSSAFDGGAWAGETSIGVYPLETEVLTTSKHLEECLSMEREDILCLVAEELWSAHD